MKRLIDIALSLSLIVVLFFPFLVICLLIKITDKGSVLYFSDRVGQFNEIFRMPKFRTMRVGTPVVATHLLADSNDHITGIGKILRKTSLDELPQLWSVIVGDMSLVGPRPALFNQDDLIKLRTEKGVDKLRPGITGWAQINGRDEIDIPVKVELDEYYLKNQGIFFDLKILILTGLKVALRTDVSH